MGFKKSAHIVLAGLFILVTGVFAAAQNDDPPPTGSIVGGTEAIPGAWPFMAAILANGNGIAANRQFCGGSLIHPRWVLTAAHCVDGSAASSIEVGLGFHDLRTNEGEEIAVTRIIVHPSYNSSTQDNDIALLELASNSTKGTPISIVSSSVNLTGLMSTAIGFGYTSEGGVASPLLLQVDLPVVSNPVCDAVYGGITNNMVCAGQVSGGIDTCQGDSGGPLVHGSGGARRLIGITSFGVGCARPNFYGVYARPANYSSWIAQYVTFASETNGPYGLWNGFINLVNIAELQNTSASDITAQVNLFDITGALVSSTSVGIPAGRQQDVIINELPGFSADSYGIVQVSNNVTGRIFYYRPVGGGFSNFEFAFGIPLSDGMTGSRYVGFNTYQPSGSAVEQGNLVANWLSVVNLESSPRNFTVRKYNDAGQVLSSETFQLAGRQRSDLDGGHQSPGRNNVGLIEIIPQDGSSEYLAQLIRYGYGTGGTYFDFAFPLIPLEGSGNPVVVPLGSRFTAQNWLEVLNPDNASQNVGVQVFNSAGANVGTLNVALAAHAQSHIDVTALLGVGATGQAIITPGVGRSVVAEGMFYFRNATTGSITSMYGSQASQASANVETGTFNLFLGMENYLKVTNPSTSSVTVDFTVSSVFSSGSSFSRTIPARGAIELDLHESATFGTVANSYGTVQVDPNSQQVQTEILRIKREPSGELQFSAPTGLN